MTNSDNKLILVRGYDEKAQIRYRKSKDALWNTIYLEETDLDKVIDQLISKVQKKNG